MYASSLVCCGENGNSSQTRLKFSLIAGVWWTQDENRKTKNKSQNLVCVLMGASANV